MKIMTILGTRPEIIRLSVIIKKLNKICDHKVVHTGQNYDKNLNDIFFEDLGLNPPDVMIDSKSNSLGEQLGKIFVGVEKALRDFQPDKVLLLGDTNSALSAIISERLGYPVYHMEAGNRCYDFKVPEENNRKVIDAVSSYNLPYTPNSRDNLLQEGMHKSKMFLTGNPIYEVINSYSNKISASRIRDELVGRDNFVLVTAHRAENVDDPERLKNIIDALKKISEKYKVVFSCHPRTRDKLDKFNLNTENIIMTEPMGFFDFISLERQCVCAISDSGTVQEECCIFGVPTVTIRDTTERPETVECGSNIISGLKSEDILSCFEEAVQLHGWACPTGYLDDKVSNKVVNFLLGNQHE